MSFKIFQVTMNIAKNIKFYWWQNDYLIIIQSRCNISILFELYLKSKLLILNIIYINLYVCTLIWPFTRPYVGFPHRTNNCFKRMTLICATINEGETTIHGQQHRLSYRNHNQSKYTFSYEWSNNSLLADNDLNIACSIFDNSISWWKNWLQYINVKRYCFL